MSRHSLAISNIAKTIIKGPLVIVMDRLPPNSHAFRVIPCDPNFPEIATRTYGKKVPMATTAEPRIFSIENARDPLPVELALANDVLGTLVCANLRKIRFTSESGSSTKTDIHSNSKLEKSDKDKSRNAVETI